MLTRAQLLEPLARHRTNQAVVTTMSVTRPWGLLSDSDLDFASADSAMGHAADLALGIAIAQPSRGVVCLNGDGSMLMTLGTLATAADSGATNYLLIVVDNGVYEITGSQAVAAGGRLDYVGLARSAGFPRAESFDDPDAWAAAVPRLLTEDGPTLVHVRIEPGTEGPIGRRASEPARYLQHSLSDWSRIMQSALTPPSPESS